MKSAFYIGYFIAIMIICISITYAGETYKTKADGYYTASSTAVLILKDDQEIQKLKENYNNTERIVVQLEEINDRLQRIERYIRR